MRYTTDERGYENGLPGWTRILRNGSVIHMEPSQEAAYRWIENKQADFAAFVDDERAEQARYRQAQWD